MPKIRRLTVRACFSRFIRGASAKTVWGSMRAEQVSIAKRWRRPRSDPEYTEQRSDIGKISEKCSKTWKRGRGCLLMRIKKRFKIIALTGGAHSAPPQYHDTGQYSAARFYVQRFSVPAQAGFAQSQAMLQVRADALDTALRRAQVLQSRFCIRAVHIAHFPANIGRRLVRAGRILRDKIFEQRFCTFEITLPEKLQRGIKGFSLARLHRALDTIHRALLRLKRLQTAIKLRVGVLGSLLHRVKLVTQ